MRNVRGTAMLAVSGLGWAVALQAQDMVCHDQWAAWAPDGAAVVFVSTVTGDHEVYSLSMTTGAVQQLTDVPGRDAHPAFSPDGRSVAFQSPRGGSGTHLYVMDRDGGNVHQVTSLPGFSGMPVWSPDGNRLAFQHRTSASDARWTLRIVSLSDGEVTALTTGVAHDQVVNWAPDGNRLSFHSDRSGVNQVYVWERGHVRQLTFGPAEHKNAAWAPDGRTMALRSTMTGEPGIYLTDPNRFDPRRVGTVVVEHGVPFFSPDGSKVLLTPSGPDGTRIVTLDLQTGEPTRLEAACDAGRDVGPDGE